MAELFGDFIDNLPPEHDSLELTFNPGSRPINQRWRNNRISAHFFADYLSSFLPIDEEDIAIKQRIKESKAAISYVANELLENAMKYNDKNSTYGVNFGIQFLKEPDLKVVVFASHSVKVSGLDKLREFIEELFSSDPKELYVSQVEKSIEEDSDASGLGFLTMMNDYSAKLGFKIETIQGDFQTAIVTTMAQIAL